MHSRPDFDLIVACTRVDHVAPLPSAGTDWTRVLTLAQRHGVTAFVHAALRETSLPGPARRALEGRASRENARKAERRAALGVVLDGLAAAGIDSVPFRCARLATSPGELVELDLLVRTPDLAAISELLSAHGFGPEIATDFVHTRAQGARRFVDRAGIVVSVQWDVADHAAAYGPAIDEMLARASAAKVDGHPCLALNRADLLLLASVRSTIKRWQRLLWVREVADLAAEASDAELQTALSRATRGGGRHALGLGASLAARLLGAPLPLRFADAARDPIVSDLAQAVLVDLVAPVRPLAGPTDIARFHVKSRERLGDKLRYAFRRATLPGPGDPISSRRPMLNRALMPWHRAISAGRQAMRRLSPVRGQHIARFVATPPHIVDRMLALARVTATDRLLDLGCGDGAIVVRAAQRIGCRGVGLDLEPELVEAARRRARAAGVEALVDLTPGDARETDLSPFTVVCLYLSAAGNAAVGPHLRRGLRRGARVVSFNFDMADWLADEVDVIDETPWGSNTLYLWHIGSDTQSQTAA